MKCLILALIVFTATSCIASVASPPKETVPRTPTFLLSLETSYDTAVKQVKDIRTKALAKIIVSVAANAVFHRAINQRDINEDLSEMNLAILKEVNIPGGDRLHAAFYAYFPIEKHAEAKQRADDIAVSLEPIKTQVINTTDQIILNAITYGSYNVDPVAAVAKLLDAKVATDAAYDDYNQQVKDVVFGAGVSAVAKYNY